MENWLLFFLLLTNTCCFAQEKMNFDVRLTNLFPLGKFNKEYNSGSGISSSVYFSVSNKSKVFFQFGFAYLSQKKNQPSDAGIIVPLLGGYRYNIVDKFYLEGSTGLAIFTGAFGSKASLNFNAGMGYLAPLFKKMDIDFFCKYSYAKYSNNPYSWICLGVGLNFFKSLSPNRSVQQEK